MSEGLARGAGGGRPPRLLASRQHHLQGNRRAVAGRCGLADARLHSGNPPYPNWSSLRGYSYLWTCPREGLTSPALSVGEQFRSAENSSPEGHVRRRSLLLTASRLNSVFVLDDN